MHSEITRFMQYADMFEKFKVAAIPVELHYVLKYEGDKRTVNDLYGLIEKGLHFAELEFGDKIVFCHILSVEQDELTIQNKNILPIFSREISVVSDGDKWTLLVNIVRHFCKGIEIEEAETRRIASLRWPSKERVVSA